MNTITQTTSVTNTAQPPSSQTVHIKLTARPEQKVEQPEPKKRPERHISWKEDTIDNEDLGRLKSNLCCIYHRPGSSSSDTCTSDDEGNALERDRATKKKHKEVCSKRKPKCQHPHGHKH